MTTQTKIDKEIAQLKVIYDLRRDEILAQKLPKKPKSEAIAKLDANYIIECLRVKRKHNLSYL